MRFHLDATRSAETRGPGASTLYLNRWEDNGKKVPGHIVWQKKKNDYTGLIYVYRLLLIILIVIPKFVHRKIGNIVERPRHDQWRT